MSKIIIFYEPSDVKAFLSALCFSRAFLKPLRKLLMSTFLDTSQNMAKARKGILRKVLPDSPTLSPQMFHSSMETHGGVACQLFLF